MKRRTLDTLREIRLWIPLVAGGIYMANKVMESESGKKIVEKVKNTFNRH